jgi:hypothetical protein
MNTGHTVADVAIVLAQHYLTHLLKDKLVASKSRIVVVSSGAIRGAKPGTSDVWE